MSTEISCHFARRRFSPWVSSLLSALICSGTLHPPPNLPSIGWLKPGYCCADSQQICEYVYIYDLGYPIFQVVGEMPTGQRKGINNQRLSDCGGCHPLSPSILHASSSPRRNLISPPQCHLKAGSAFSPISPPLLYFRWRHVLSVSVALLKSSAGLLAPGRYNGDNGSQEG